MKGNSEEYVNAFQAFLRCTNEKQIFCSKLLGLVWSWKISSILDIGAGNGDLAIPLSKAVNNYVAIEPVPNHAVRLRQNGIRVIDSLFPCDPLGMYDLVLISHSLPWQAEKYEPFLETAWNNVRENGHMLVITYDDETSDWNDLLLRCGLPWKRSERIGKLARFLSASFSCATPKYVTSTVVSKDIEDVMKALAFVYSDGEPRKFELFMQSDTVRGELASMYRTLHGEYSFPFVHLWFSAKKISAVPG